MGGCEEAGRRGCESSEVEDSNETMIDSSSALNPTSEGDTRGGGIMEFGRIGKVERMMVAH